MHIVLAAVEDSLVRAWEQFCGDIDGLTIHRGTILEVACDAVVSPANSFGFMDGGLDALYLDHFGPPIQMAVRRAIYEHHHGELLVGAAEIVETGDERIPYLIVAPTMRVPMVLHDSVNAYLAMRAVLVLCSTAYLPPADTRASGSPNTSGRWRSPGWVPEWGGWGRRPAPARCGRP